MTIQHWWTNNLGLRQRKKFIYHFTRDDNWHHLNPKTGDLGYGWAHYAFVRNFKPKRILCVGSKYGYIPAVCALACRHNQKGKVDFVDAGYDIKNEEDQDIHWGGVGFWKTKQGRKQFNKFGLKPFVELHVMTTADFFKDNKQDWDYIYLDGDHSYQGVKFDFEQAWPRLKPTGLLALHDISTPDADGNQYGVRKLWAELKAQKRYNTLTLPGTCGLGFIQK